MTHNTLSFSLHAPAALPPPPNSDRWSVPRAHWLLVTNEWPAILTHTGGQKKDEELEPGGDVAADAQAGEQVRAKLARFYPCSLLTSSPLQICLIKPHQRMNNYLW